MFEGVTLSVTCFCFGQAGEAGCSDDSQPSSAKSRAVRLKYGLKDKEVAQAVKVGRVYLFSNKPHMPLLKQK